MADHNYCRLDPEGQVARRTRHEAPGCARALSVIAQGPSPMSANLAVALLRYSEAPKFGLAAREWSIDMRRYAVTPGLSTYRSSPPYGFDINGAAVALVKALKIANGEPTTITAV